MHRRIQVTVLGAVVALMASLGSYSHADPAEGPDEPDSSTALAGFDANTIEVNRVVGLLTELGEKYPTVASPMTIDYTGARILQRYNAEEPEATAFVESVSKLDQGSIEIKLDAVDYTTQDLEETTIQLFEDHALAEEVFGSVPQEIGYTDQGLDVTLAEGAPLPRRSSESLLGVPTTVRVATEEPPTSDGWQTSGADQSPWTGGSAINSGTGLCTSGFTWDKWTTREKMGSTAEHCYQLASPQPATQTWKTPPGTTVGNRYFFNIAADTQLIRAASGTSFRPRVWVGYNDPRTVKEYKSSVPATQVVALYGRTSGYHSTTVLGHFPRTMLDGSTTVLARTNSNVCQPGDSGGPWFYARGDGNIVAVGQHVGEWSRCEFVQIGTISASLSASVYLG